MDKEDKKLIKTYFNWCNKKGIGCHEYDCSKLIENMNGDHRNLVEDYLNELKFKTVKLSDEQRY